MNTKYPALAAMGIVNPEQIQRYNLHTSGSYDVLRIVYKRERGSLLPGSKKFKFHRHTRLIELEGGNKNLESITEISPELSGAIAELHKIVNLKHTHDEQKEIIMDEILRLEEEVHTRVTYLKTLIKKLDE